MKRNKLSTALALATAMGGLAGAAYAPSAGAISIAAQNLGDVLIFPYYTARCHKNELGIVEDCWQTLFNITNTSDQTLVVKLKFLEGYNSRDALDFTVVLSAHDVFAGYVDKGANYPAQDTPARFVKAHGETTCTVPFISQTTGLSFSKFAYSAGNRDHDAAVDEKMSSNDRTYEGYVVAIVEGHAPAVPLPGTPGSYPDSWVSAHVTNVADDGETAGGVNCDAVRTSFTKANIVTTANEFGEPINALKGNYNLLNVKRGVAAGGSATTLANFIRISPDDDVPQPGLSGGCVAGNMRFDSATSLRNLAWAPALDNTIANLDNTIANNAWCPNLITAQSNQPGYDHLEPSLADAYDSAVTSPSSIALVDPTSTVVEGTWPNGAGFAAVSEVLRAAELINEWSFNPGLGVSTEWVVTHPTKNFFVDSWKYWGPMSAYNDRRFPFFIYPIPLPPFAEAFSGVTDGQSCNQVTPVVYNRSEVRAVLTEGGVIQSPLPRSDDMSLCFETNVIQFSAGRPVLDSKLTLNLTDGMAQAFGGESIPAGWLDLDLTTSQAAQWGVIKPGVFGGFFAEGPLLGSGLPAIGFMIKQRALTGDYFKNFAYLIDHSRKIPYESQED
ncbi:MAG: hypothetical protein IPM89_01620 [Candidatus Competibacteraceae bacterium]|nr:MAG: hypothetical protein IPM89_01620 [Candidatus Competibacteraceae bacterium]